MDKLFLFSAIYIIGCIVASCAFNALVYNEIIYRQLRLRPGRPLNVYDDFASSRVPAVLLSWIGVICSLTINYLVYTQHAKKWFRMF